MNIIKNKAVYMKCIRNSMAYTQILPVILKARTFDN